MSRLVVNPGSPNAWEIQLKTGVNSLGRGAANDFTIDDPSISSSHCQIVIGDSGAVLTDLGSTNGTCINREPIQTAVLQPGQRIQLGTVEILFESDAATPSPPGPKRVVIARRSSQEAPAALPQAVPVSRLTFARRQPAEEGVAPPTSPPLAHEAVGDGAVEEAIDAAPPVAPVAVGAAFCKSHTKIPATFYCGQCAKYFCDLCVSTRRVGGVMQRTCRKCGAECTPVEAHFGVTAPPKGFFARLPGAFVYPFRGTGLMVLIAATLVFSALDYLSAGILGILIKVLALGYLFSYMQNIIHSTAAEDNEMPELPGMDDLFGGFFRLAGTALISFGPAAVLAYLAIAQEQPAAGVAMIPAIILGCLYFPMAFLAVAMKDSVAAANPLVVVPAILKTPLAYLVTAILLIGVFGVRQLGDVVMGGMKGVFYSTRSVSVLFLTFGLRALWSLTSVYLLTVTIRILGLLYVTKKEKLGWF